MECPDCLSAGWHPTAYVYRRKTKTPEWRCRSCESTWDDPYIDGHVEPSFERTLAGGCPKCGARGYNKDIRIRTEERPFFKYIGAGDPYPEDNYKGCMICGHEWAISDHEGHTNYLLPIRPRHRGQSGVPYPPLKAMLEDMGWSSENPLDAAIKKGDIGGVVKQIGPDVVACSVIAGIAIAIFIGVVFLLSL